jgi:hypothetical protein
VINMMVAIALTGGLALLTLAIAVGMLQTRSVNAAWARIAVTRRLLHERNRWLDEREAELAARQEELDRWQRRR